MKQAVWDLDPHTKAKHIILRKYLDAWLPKITRYNPRVIYFDGFAGPGVYKGGEDGSPIIALNSFLQHTHKQHIKCEIKYYFVEEDKDRFTHLNNIIEEKRPTLPSTVVVNVTRDQSDTALRRILDQLEGSGKGVIPTFAFIDPFGISGVPLDTVKRLMSNSSCEVMINVMVGYIHRFVSHPEFEKHCDDLFGCENWRDARVLNGDDREIFLRQLYFNQLRNGSAGVGARYVRYFTMRNERNRPIYDLFFATNHPVGIDAMKDAMWKVDASGEYSFSDATNPDQQTLFTPEPDWQSLIVTLRHDFAGQAAPWPNVEEAIRCSPFRILKRQVYQTMTQSDSGIKIINPPGVRRNTLNEDTLIQFGLS